jgi:BASS family bile acid:Na+ symporter
MKTVFDLAILVFVVCSVVSVGLDLSLKQVVAPLTRFRLIATAILANFVMVPLATLALTRIIPLTPPLAAGLILLGAAAGAPFLPKLVETAGEDVPTSAALMVLLLGISQFYLPLMLPWMLPGVTVDSWRISQSLLVTMILPLAGAMLLNAFLRSWALVLRPVFSVGSNVSLAVALVVAAVQHLNHFRSLFGSGACLASLAFIAVSFAAGYLVGGPTRESRILMAFATATRNYAAALLISHQNFSDPGVAIMVMLVAVLSLIVLVSGAIVNRRYRAKVVSPTAVESGIV